MLFASSKFFFFATWIVSIQVFFKPLTGILLRLGMLDLSLFLLLRFSCIIRVLASLLVGVFLSRFFLSLRTVFCTRTRDGSAIYLLLHLLSLILISSGRRLVTTESCQWLSECNLILIPRLRMGTCAHLLRGTKVLLMPLGRETLGSGGRLTLIIIVVDCCGLLIPDAFRFRGKCLLQNSSGFLWWNARLTTANASTAPGGLGIGIGWNGTRMSWLNLHGNFAHDCLSAESSSRRTDVPRDWRQSRPNIPFTFFSEQIFPLDPVILLCFGKRALHFWPFIEISKQYSKVVWFLR